jgi:hypothetical protein
MKQNRSMQISCVLGGADIDRRVGLFSKTEIEVQWEGRMLVAVWGNGVSWVEVEECT